MINSKLPRIYRKIFYAFPNLNKIIERKRWQQFKYEQNVLISKSKAANYIGIIYSIQCSALTAV